MKQEQLYTILNKVKGKLNKQQYLTIKGQIKANDTIGAYKGIKRLVIKNEL